MVSLRSWILLAAGLAWLCGPAPARASVPLTANVHSGYNFSGFQRNLVLDGTGFLPLGNLVGLVDTQLVLSAVGSDLDILLSLPGADIGDTVVVNDGETVDFTFLADLAFFVELADVDPSADFGGGLSQTVFTTLVAQFQGSGQAVVDTSLPNLGFFADLNSLSLTLGGSGGGLLDLTLPDLDGNGVPELLGLGSAAFAQSGSRTAGFAYARRAKTVITLVEDGPVTRIEGSVNPDFELDLAITDWVIEQDTVVPAQVPEPAPAILLWAGLLAVLRSRRAAAASCSPRCIHRTR